MDKEQIDICTYREVKRVTICGVGIDSLTLDELLSHIDWMVGRRCRGYVSFVDANLFSCALRDPTVARVLGEASLALPDGAGLVATARLIGEPLDQRLVGPDVMLSYCRHGVALGRRHFFYGGAPDIAELMKEMLLALVPGLQIVGTFSPPFRPLLPEEEQEVKRLIEDSKADLVWVGLGAPKQDFWMAEHAGNLDVPLMLGVGAAFNYLSGTTKRAPIMLQKMGMEWLYRMCTQGRRIFWRNAHSLPFFCFSMLKEVLKVRFGLK